jgi:hypothetical protein
VALSLEDLVLEIQLFRGLGSKLLSKAGFNGLSFERQFFAEVGRDNDSRKSTVLTLGGGWISSELYLIK